MAKIHFGMSAVLGQSILITTPMKLRRKSATENDLLRNRDAPSERSRATVSLSMVQGFTTITHIRSIQRRSVKAYLTSSHTTKPVNESYTNVLKDVVANSVNVFSYTKTTPIFTGIVTDVTITISWRVKCLLIISKPAFSLFSLHDRFSQEQAK